jgi:hypothetical protein
MPACWILIGTKSKPRQTVTSLHVVNPGGGDPDRRFPDGAGSPGDPGHPPVNYHAYAACTRGMFARAVDSLPVDARVVLLLLRPKHLSAAARALVALRARDLRVFVSLKESGLHQAVPALTQPGHWRAFVEICHAADGFLSSTEDLVPLYNAAGTNSGGFIPTPYPIGEPKWNFARPLTERTGIFIGTREFDVPARNHLLAIATAASLGEPVTVINTEGGRGRRMIHAISPSIHIVEGPLPYADYLRLMAAHRVVFQLDRGSVPGQVGGDALLTGTPCIGGDSATERLAFAAPSRTDVASALADIKLLMEDDAIWQARTETALETAAKSLSFPAVHTRLTEFLALTH